MRSWYGARRGQVPWIDPARPDDFFADVSQDAILDLLGGLTGRGLGFAMSLQPRREQALLDILEAASPSRDGQDMREASAAMLGSAASAGRQGAARLRSMGFGRSAQAGAELDARNQAVSRSHDAWLARTSPEARIARLSALLGLMDRQSTPGALAFRNQGQQMKWAKDAQDDAQAGSLFGDLLGIGSLVLPEIGSVWGRRSK